MYYTQSAVKAQSHYLSPEPAANECPFWWGLLCPRIMTVLSAQEERAGDVCSAWGLLSASSSCGQGKEGDLEHEELLGDSTERAEEGVEVAQGGTAWGDTKLLPR